MLKCHAQWSRALIHGPMTYFMQHLSYFSLVVDVMKQIDIPSVFVSEETANSLKEEYIYDKG